MPRHLGYTTVRILKALSAGLRYGLDIMDRTGLPSGTVYPALQRLERMGHVTARWESESVAHAEGRPQRRYYRLTGSGAAALNAAIRRYGALAADTEADGAHDGAPAVDDGPTAAGPAPEQA